MVDAVEDYAIFALDLHGNILTWNKGAQRLKGYLPKEVIGSHFSRFYLPVDIQRNHPEYELAIALKVGKYEEEGWRKRKDGTIFWANVVITALRDASGEIRGFGKVTRDLTTRRNAEVALRESEERFRLMVEEVVDYAIFMLDPSGRIATWNKGAERNKGYSAKEIIGQHFSTFYSEEEKAAGKPESELTEALKSGRFEDEGWRLRKDGKRFWANVIITPVKDASGRLIGFSKVTRNLTERKAAEDGLREAHADLEKRIEERTIELRKAKESAERAVKSRDEFFSMASHELRTPLTSLKLQTQIRKRSLAKGDFSDFAPDKLMDLCEDDERQIGRLAFLVDNMLDISRISSGNFELKISSFDINELVRGALKRMDPVLKDSNVKSSVRVQAPIMGHWDFNRLEQVISNLLSNAAKYAPGNPVEILVAEKEGHVRVCVKDSGKGIAKEHQQKIFSPFERIRDRENVSGLGLGLYICFRIVEAHGGRIWVESEPGYGTNFILEIPLDARNINQGGSNA